MRRIKQTWDTYSGLFTLTDLFGFIGFWLYRGTFRRTMGVAIALAALLLLGKKTDAFGVDLKTALSGTGAIFFLSFAGGLAMMMISGTFSKAALRKAETKGANLLEDMKRARKELHRDRLWQQVYRYEQVLYSVDERRDELKRINAHRTHLEDLCDPNRAERLSEAQRHQIEPIVDTLGTTEEGWRIAFEHAMQVPRGLSLLTHQYRYNLTYIKDWYDGAPFHHTDTKLAEHFDYHGDLAEARKDLQLGPLSLVTKARRRATQKLWFRVISRAVQVRVSTACARLDAKYEPFHFTTDCFLWPSPEVERLVRNTLGPEALEDLNDTRRSLFQKVFHQDFDLAHKLMQKAIYPNFSAATKLREAYDPQYVVGELADEWCEDVHRYDKAFRQSAVAELGRQRARRRARLQQRQLRDFLRRYPDLLADASPHAHRAIRIAYHIDYHFLRTMIESGRALDNDEPVTLMQRYTPTIDRLLHRDRPRSIRGVIERVVEEGEQFTRKLLAVRMHHELTRLELEDYEFYLNRILR